MSFPDEWNHQSARPWRTLPNRESRETMADYVERIGEMLDNANRSGIERQRLEFTAADAIYAHGMGIRL